MIWEERTEMKHDKRGGIFSMLRRSLITSDEDSPITPHSKTNWLHDRQLSLRISQARYLRQSYDPIQVGPFPPK